MVFELDGLGQADQGDVVAEVLGVVPVVDLEMETEILVKSAGEISSWAYIIPFLGKSN